MGQRGPAPTPTPILNARGSTKPKRAERRNEPDVQVAEPPVPKELSERARGHWRFIVPELLQRRTLSKADLGFLGMMCVEWAEYMEAVGELEELKKSDKGYKGHMIDHPRARMRGAFERYSKAAIQFGLSPASKARVQSTPQDEPQPQTDETPTLRIA